VTQEKYVNSTDAIYEMYLYCTTDYWRNLCYQAMARNVEELLPNYTMDTGKHWMLYIWKTFHGLYHCIFTPSRLLQMEKKSNHVSFKNDTECAFLEKVAS
jgi:hypothetical protein